MNSETEFAEAAKRLRNAERVVILSGAGISAESGMPTFRDRLTGFWQHYDPMQLATAAAFRQDPRLVWGWYQWRRSMLARTHPNAAHRAVAALANRVQDLTVITQNVDDLHERAGSHDVIHLHGELNRPRCFACARIYDGTDPEAIDDFGSPLEPPRCF